MHPLHDCLPDLKSQLVGTAEDGVALDVFSDARDLETYASTSLQTVYAVVADGDDVRAMVERAPTRPATHVACVRVNTERGLAALRAHLTSRAVCVVWIYMNRFRFDVDAFARLMRTLYPLLSDDANVFLLCIDRGLAVQHARSRLVYIDRDDNMLLHYERQPLANVLDVSRVKEVCERSGYVHEKTIRGDELLHTMRRNALPYDIWSSQIFFLLHFGVRPHFKKLL